MPLDLGRFASSDIRTDCEHPDRKLGPSRRARTVLNRVSRTVEIGVEIAVELISTAIWIGEGVRRAWGWGSRPRALARLPHPITRGR